LAAKLAQDPGSNFRAAERKERVRRFVVPAALAAGLALVFMAAYQPHVTRPTATTTTTATVAAAAASSQTNGAKTGNVHDTATDAAQLAALQQRSQELEHWLRETGNAAAPLQGQDLAAATEIENLIGLVDVELAAPREMRDASLWRRRVDLLEDLSVLRYSNSQLAAGGRFAAASLTN
jgi:hypothetical protein